MNEAKESSAQQSRHLLDAHLEIINVDLRLFYSCCYMASVQPLKVAREHVRRRMIELLNQTARDWSQILCRLGMIEVRARAAYSFFSRWNCWRLQTGLDCSSDGLRGRPNMVDRAVEAEVKLTPGRQDDREQKLPRWS